MPTRPSTELPTFVERCLLALAAGRSSALERDEIERLIACDCAHEHPDGRLEITPVGRSYLARRQAVREGGGIDPFIAQHLDLVPLFGRGKDDAAPVVVDMTESPLMWLARRRARDGRPLIALEQLQAGERLRAEFTRAQMTPRVTSNWTASIAQGRRSGADAGHVSDVIVAARQRMRFALEAVGPEFAGLLLDVCCFLKGLEDVERERRWPPRSAKLVLQLGLNRLARHYGLTREARGRAHGVVRRWAVSDAMSGVGEVTGD